MDQRSWRGSNRGSVMLGGPSYNYSNGMVAHFSSLLIKKFQQLSKRFYSLISYFIAIHELWKEVQLQIILK